jgi:NAD(P)-dependent dehydrogenase (short-subunit alcohol dehydrogenase family)
MPTKPKKTPTNPKKNPVVLLAGATGGIGPAIARRLARDGFSLLLVSRRRLAEARALAREIGGQGVGARAIAGDVGDPAFAARAIAEARSLGSFEGVIAAVGELFLGSPSRTTPADLRRQLETNVVAPWTLARAALPALAWARNPRIVFFGMAGSGTAKRTVAAHAAAKQALLMMARSLAREVAPRGIVVLTIAPGVVATSRSRRAAVEPFLRQVPAGRANTPEEVADAVAFCLRPEAAPLTGGELPVANGFGL